MPAVPDDFGQHQWFKITLDGDKLKEESWFHEVTGLDVHIDCLEIQEGGKNDGAWKRPGPARFSHICLKRGVTKSKAFFEWISGAVNRQVKRMGGKISLCQRDGTPILEWTFEKGWPCRYEGPHFDSRTGDLALEVVEIAHEGLKMQGMRLPGGEAGGGAAGGGGGGLGGALGAAAGAAGAGGAAQAAAGAAAGAAGKGGAGGAGGGEGGGGGGIGDVLGKIGGGLKNMVGDLQKGDIGAAFNDAKGVAGEVMANKDKLAAAGKDVAGGVEKGVGDLKKGDVGAVAGDAQKLAGDDNVKGGVDAVKGLF